MVTESYWQRDSFPDGGLPELNELHTSSGKQTIAHPAGQVGGPGEGLYIVLSTFLH